MGWWETGEGDVIGDPALDLLLSFEQAHAWVAPADMPPKALESIVSEYRAAFGRSPNDSEVTALLAFHQS
ncbi:hypothetical protein JYU10_00505 [bacterium AH-315-J04]|nr:hypothetical protein [bacterium AH-315-J04]